MTTTTANDANLTNAHQQTLLMGVQLDTRLCISPDGFFLISPVNSSSHKAAKQVNCCTAAPHAFVSQPSEITYFTLNQAMF